MDDQIRPADSGQPVILLAGERILWEGRPDPKAYGRRTALLIGSIMPFVSVGIVALKALPFAVSLKLYQWLLIAAVGCIVGIPVYFDAQSRSRKIRYFVTDRRVLVDHEVQDPKTRAPRIDRVELNLSSIHPTLRMGSGGIGTINLGAGVYRFHDLPDARDAYRILLVLTPTSTNTSSDRLMNQTDSPSHPRAEMPFNDASSVFQVPLRPGEVVVWTGAPDPGMYVRTQGLRAFTGVGFLITLFDVLFRLAGTIPSNLAAVLIFAAAASILLPLMAWGLRREAASRRYAITNARLLLEWWFGSRRVEERALCSIEKYGIIRHRDGYGSLIFDRNVTVVGESVAVNEFAFRAIPDVEGVIRTIKFLAENAK